MWECVCSFYSFEGVNNFVSLGVSASLDPTIFKCQDLQCFQGFVGSAHTRPLE